MAYSSLRNGTKDQRPINSPGGVIYMCLDAAGDPLYIGKTVDWSQRRKGHMGSMWWPRVAVIHFIPAFDHEFRTRTERALIGLLDPEFNMAHTLRMQIVKSAPSPHRWESDQDGQERVRRERKSAAERRRAAKLAEMDGRGPREVGLDGFSYKAHIESTRADLTCGHCLRPTVSTKSIHLDGETIWLCGPESGCACYTLVTRAGHALGCEGCQGHILARDSR